MMRAYNESYINKAKKNLGNMFDFAINMAGESGDEFWYQFAHSDLLPGSAKSLRKMVSECVGRIERKSSRNNAT